VWKLSLSQQAGRGKAAASCTHSKPSLPRNWLAVVPSVAISAWALAAKCGRRDAGESPALQHQDLTLEKALL
jgi:hypothetical protein